MIGLQQCSSSGTVHVPTRSGVRASASTRRRPGGGASDRALLLASTEGQEALERSASGRALREVGVRRRAHLPGDGQAHPQKSAVKPWLKQAWSIPPKQDAEEFVWRMEDVL